MKDGGRPSKRKKGVFWRPAPEAVPSPCQGRPGRSTCERADEANARSGGWLAFERSRANERSPGLAAPGDFLRAFCRATRSGTAPALSNQGLTAPPGVERTQVRSGRSARDGRKPRETEVPLAERSKPMIPSDLFEIRWLARPRCAALQPTWLWLALRPMRPRSGGRAAHCDQRASGDGGVRRIHDGEHRRAAPRRDRNRWR